VQHTATATTEATLRSTAPEPPRGVLIVDTSPELPHGAPNVDASPELPPGTPIVDASPMLTAIARGSAGAIASAPAGERLASPAGVTSSLPACAGSSIPLAAEALIASCATASTAHLTGTLGAEVLPLQLGTELSPASAISHEGGDNRPTMESSASSPSGPTHAPSPLPGGSSGAMASSATGVGSLIFLTLVGLLLMGGLAAMRLLRLASKPWRPAPFVLIPERPG
jgi:hypothetical protein